MRTVTAVIEIECVEKAKWLWDAMSDGGNSELGIKRVTALANGDCFETMEDKEYFIKEEGEDLVDAIACHLDGGSTDIESLKELMNCDDVYQIVGRDDNVVFDSSNQ